MPQLARVMDAGRREARRLLDELADAGLLEQVGEVSWRLSPEAEQLYGAALREWTL